MRLQFLSCYIITILILTYSYPVTAQSNDFGEPFFPDRLYDSQNILSTNFSTPISCGVSGSSGEFAFEQTDSDVLTLNWTHIPETSLDYVTDGYSIEYIEFAYFQQEFYWDHDVLPTYSNMSLLFNVTTTGTFHNDSAPSMFEIRTWLVNPNDEWDHFATFRCYEDRLYNDYDILGSWATDNTFEELVSNEDAFPSRLVVGLIPSWSFHNDFTEPWRYYNGSVIVEFYEARFNTLYRTERDLPKEGDPLYQTNWVHGISESFQDSYTTPAGISYILSVERHENLHNEISLTALNPKVELNWQKSWNDTAKYRWYHIAGSSNAVFLLGAKLNSYTEEFEMCVLALDVDGSVIWERMFPFEDFEYPIDIEVDNLGNIYVAYTRFGSTERSCLVKLDSGGNTLWRSFFEGIRWEIIEEVGISQKEDIYTLSAYHITKWNNDGTQEWSIDGYYMTMYVLFDGSLLTSGRSSSGEFELTKHNSLGQEEWVKSISIEYDEGWEDYFGVAGFTESQDGTLFVLIGLFGFHPGRIILEMTTNGTSISNYTVAFSSELYQSFDVPQYVDIAITDDGLLYLYGRMVDENWDYSIVVSVFGIEPFFFSNSKNALVGSTIAASIILCTIAVLQMKKRRTTH